MIKKIFPVIISVIIGFLFAGCNDSPTDLGKKFVDQDNVNISEFTSDSTTQYSRDFKKVYALGSSTRLLVGKSENVTASTLIVFYFTFTDTTILDAIKSNDITVTDSWIELIKDYRFGDSAATFDFNVYKVEQFWNASTFTSDSLESLPVDYSTNLGSSLQTLNDTTYSFNLNNDEALRWLQVFADTSNGENNGILLKPTDVTQKIIGFTAFNSSGTNEPVVKIVVQPNGSDPDTVTGYVLSDVSVVQGEIADVGTEDLAIQSSLASEANIYFDLSVLPKNITINSATLTLTIDSAKTKVGTTYSNYVYAYLTADSTIDSVNSNYFAKLDRSSNTFTGKITNIVTAWEESGKSNQGIIIKSGSEFFGVELFAIKGSNASVHADRPKLNIIYSRK